MVLVSPLVKICNFFFHCWRVGRVGAVSEKRKKKKKKKRDTAGHRNPARHTRSSVRHVLDTDMTPKMACPCNLAWRQWQKQLQKSYLENIPWLEKLHSHHSYVQQGLLFHEKEELPWSPSKAWNSQNLIRDHLPTVGWFQKRLSLMQWHCALKILAVSQACTKTKLQGMLHELAQSACQFLVAPP